MRDSGWINVYRYFTDLEVWPRGLPLDAVHGELPSRAALPVALTECPIQNGLADQSPDVDAIHRLLRPAPLDFDPDATPLALGTNAWCPFNSQNTVWRPCAFPLLYLPTTCSFRMTDIWRSFVAQRIAWAKGWSIAFLPPTVRQERNEHDLLRDFADEVPGYLHNRKIASALGAVEVGDDPAAIHDDLRGCYRALVAGSWIEAVELELLEAWLDDLRELRRCPGAESHARSTSSE
ncbi:MAG: STELLO glycosyltransferase family protein [Planctomycetota bacterium]